MNEMMNRSNLKVLGTSSSLGGYFLEIKVTGECKFAGDVDCQSLSLTGETAVSGSLRMEKLKMTGELSVKKRMEGGMLRGHGEVQAGSVSARQLKFSGSLEVGGDCEAEELQVSGALRIKGLLSAETLQLTLYGPSSAAEVGGSTITVKRSKTKTLLHLGQGQDMVFTSGLIEGDYVELQNTYAGTVRGEKIIIGPGCVIQLVEYRDYLEIHKSATVLEQRKYVK
ncbi:hypothetical protein [Paenibacillus tianjinensis]|uniref:Protein CcmA, bactofilin family n=1 Tax=Paenibacillus tianjinensis TaxID=2810347 RepID=A0ABX7L5F7_9BACL|nr:hypothetical protein [Paenibacillus tianjinensis]QSF43089.1 hypothetical protein JRJ22_17565 [Paenibacillus tianjinensis]